MKYKYIGTAEELIKLGFKEKEMGYIKTLKVFDFEGLERTVLVIKKADMIILFGHRKEWATKQVYNYIYSKKVEKVKPFIKDLINRNLVKEIE